MLEIRFYSSKEEGRNVEKHESLIELRAGGIAHLFSHYCPPRRVRVLAIERRQFGEIVARCRVLSDQSYGLSGEWNRGAIIEEEIRPYRCDLIPARAVRFLKSRGGKLSPRPFRVVDECQTVVYLHQ